MVISLRNKKFLTSNLIAHRGIHHRFLENSIQAFDLAIKKNMIIELDVRLSKDRVVLVFHDANLKRIFGIDQELKDLTLEEIKKYKYIPTLEEVLNLVKGQVPILIEIKYDYPIGVLEKRVSKLLDQYQGEFAIQSFNPLSIFWFRLNRPKYIRGYLIHSIFPNNFLLHKILNHNFLKKIIKPDFIGINLIALKSKQIQKLRKKYFVIGYTIKKEEEYQSYDSYADNFISDIPEKLIFNQNKETVPLRTASQKE